MHRKINEIGEELAEIYKVPHLTSVLRKRMATSVHIELSHEHALCEHRLLRLCIFKEEAMDRERLVTENQ